MNEFSASHIMRDVVEQAKDKSVGLKAIHMQETEMLVIVENTTIVVGGYALDLLGPMTLG